MNEFKAPPSFSSAPLSLPAPGDNKEDVSVKGVSEGLLISLPHQRTLLKKLALKYLGFAFFILYVSYILVLIDDSLSYILSMN